MTSSKNFAERFGPWALITGASDGIGASLAAEIAGRGVNVALTARRLDRLESLAEKLSSQHGIETRIVAADLSESDGPSKVISAVDGLEIGLFAGSAGYATAGRFLDNNREDELDMIDVNCRALVELCHATAGPMKGRQRGGIVLLSSIVAFQGVARMANYAATKAFVQTFSEGLAKELAVHGISVVSSAPGPVNTGFADRADIIPGKAAHPDEVARATLKALITGGTVRPGALAKLLGWNLAVLPRGLRTKILSGIMAGTMKHRNA